jgi:hypothetical protein
MLSEQPTNMKALLPTGNLNEMVRLAEVAEPEPADDEAVIAVEASLHQSR